MSNTRCRLRGRVDDFSLFDRLSSFYFLLIEFNCTFSISYKMLPYYIYYYFILIRRWFGHAEKMDEYRMARRVLMTELSGGQVRWRPRLGWMDGVKVALGNRGMTVEALRQGAKRSERVESHSTYVTE